MHEYITNSIYILASIVISIYILNIYVNRYHRKLWNDGFCKETGIPWDLIYIEPDGERIYTDHKGNYIYIYIQAGAGIYTSPASKE